MSVAVQQEARPVRYANARSQLLPFVPDRALLCRYSHGALVQSDSVLTATERGKLRDAVNANGTVITSGVTECPAGFFGHVLGYFSSRSESISIYLETSGCAVATNGSRVEYFAFTGSTQRELGKLVGARLGDQ